MPRKSRSYDKHTPLPDPKYGSVKYAKFINYMMERGKKNTARQIFYDALEIVTEKLSEMPAPAPQAAQAPSAVPAKSGSKPKTGETSDKLKPEQKGPSGKPEDQHKAQLQKLDGRTVFDQALKNAAPLMELKSRRIGGANYQVPMEVMEPRRTAIGMKWMIAAARSKKGQPMAQKLAGEIMDAYNKTGAAMKKREDTHRMAEANKAFAHFARFNRR